VRDGQHPQVLRRDLFQVVRPFKHSGILCQVLFTHAAKRAQEVAQSRPDPLHGVAVYFVDPITVEVRSPLTVAVANRHMDQPKLIDVVVGSGFIGVDGLPVVGGFMNERLNRVLLGVRADVQAKLPAFSIHEAEHGRSVVSEGASPASLVRALSGRIVWVVMRPAFFSPAF